MSKEKDYRAGISEALRSIHKLDAAEQQKMLNAAADLIDHLLPTNAKLESALETALGNTGFKGHIKPVLEFHREQFPFEKDDINSDVRDRYYWLSGFLNHYAENAFDPEF